MSALEFHPLANIFPLMEGEDFNKLAADGMCGGMRSGQPTQ
jgi:hypothetical protein